AALTRRSPETPEHHRIRARRRLTARSGQLRGGRAPEVATRDRKGRTQGELRRRLLASARAGARRAHRQQAAPPGRAATRSCVDVYVNVIYADLAYWRQST